jgi:hypothetical protein
MFNTVRNLCIFQVGNQPARTRNFGMKGKMEQCFRPPGSGSVSQRYGSGSGSNSGSVPFFIKTEDNVREGKL